ncbi:hypothetical protein FOIG_08909 [Fusarium odoratissimum NRRL 54006]|uniref:Uncharacterized protein n=2 Tax=Fusarium oxysporum species complex TaxID=171631 RepID=X0KQD2_FUSO5|nr:uncharacterized protein FOIG_08909 [Fusarium odoratissimum NRRL 54006]EXL99004.1 hypothetical protein FOIG_08909 [Fusarium odoratissimum NRRL 54006]TXC00934.1 hypothetical protein FocTR4_00009195 [Fusarium oxysporum f. sp. cubense]
MTICASTWSILDRQPLSESPSRITWPRLELHLSSPAWSFETRPQRRNTSPTSSSNGLELSTQLADSSTSKLCWSLQSTTAVRRCRKASLYRCKHEEKSGAFRRDEPNRPQAETNR